MQAIFGHERALAVIHAAMRSGRMHHAWIFHGPPGVGKCAVARNIAQALLCHAPKENKETACGACPSCRLFATDGAAHPDLRLIYKELAAVSSFSGLRKKKQSNIPLDLLRETMVGGWVEEQYLDPAVGMKPMMNHGKVFIIDEANLLDAMGQNVLLKTMEEPPPDTYIFLITAHEERLLPTIRSRCQRVAFGELEDAVVERWLAGHAAAAALQPAQRAWVARFARGSLGRAAFAAEYRMDLWAESLDPMVARLAAGKPDPRFGATMAKLVDDYAKAWVENHKGASKEAANKAGVLHMLGLLGETCRRNLREAVPRARADDPIAADALARPWLRGIDLLQEAERNMESNVAFALLLDHLAIQWGVEK